MSADRQQSRHALLAGGGTGGHLFPAYAVGEELERRGWRVTFAGRPTGLEAHWAEQRSKSYVAFPAQAVVGRGAVAKAKAAMTVLLSGWQARGWVRRQQVHVVVGTGGYVSAPAVLGARWAGRPAILFEPNAAPGKANLWLSRWATEVAVAFDSAGEAMSCPFRLTGTPVREAFFDARTAAMPGLENGRRLLIVGGSQGAQQINQTLPEVVARLLTELPDLEVLHQTGEAHLAATETRYRSLDCPMERLELRAFVDDMPATMARSHLIVSRAGAITLSEICAVGRPVVLIPLGIAGGHQIDNARQLAATGGAEMLLGDELTPERVIGSILPLFRDEAELRHRADTLRNLARPDATAAIADRVEALEEAA